MSPCLLNRTGDLIDVHDLVGSELPADRLDVLFDLLGLVTLATCDRGASQENASSSMVWSRDAAKASSFSAIAMFFSFMWRSPPFPSCSNMRP